MNATVVLWKDGLITASIPFQTIAAARWYTQHVNSHPIGYRQHRALLVY